MPPYKNARMTTDLFAEVLEVINRTDLAEVGGGHNQKGVDFQRHWAVMRMFQLEQEGAEDFLILFEAIQDVAILDSATSPTTICAYQVKKKDRKEWAWADLTALNQPSDPAKPEKKHKQKPLSEIKQSPLGKLYATVRAFKELKSTGRFISNAGFDLPLADGTNAATSLPSALSELSAHYLELLSKGLETLHEAGEPVPDLSLIHLEKVSLPVDDPGTQIVGLIHKFLDKRSPRHAGQARALADSLLARIGPLGAKTDTCKTFDDMRRQRGFSKAEFSEALGALEEIPDLLEHLTTWLNQLSAEGLGIMDVTAIRAAAASIYSRQVMGSKLAGEDELIVSCDKWLSSHEVSWQQIRPVMESAYADLKEDAKSFKKPEILAQFLLRAIKICVDLT